MLSSFPVKSAWKREKELQILMSAKGLPWEERKWKVENGKEVCLGGKVALEETVKLYLVVKGSWRCSKLFERLTGSRKGRCLASACWRWGRSRLWVSRHRGRSGIHIRAGLVVLVWARLPRRSCWRSSGWHSLDGCRRWWPCTAGPKSRSLEQRRARCAEAGRRTGRRRGCRRRTGCLRRCLRDGLRVSPGFPRGALVMARCVQGWDNQWRSECTRIGSRLGTVRLVARGSWELVLSLNLIKNLKERPFKAVEIGSRIGLQLGSKMGVRFWWQELLSLTQSWCNPYSQKGGAKLSLVAWLI